MVVYNGRQFPDVPFLNYYDEIVTYKEIETRSKAFASYLLSKGVKKGDMVAFMLGNSPQFFYALLGAQRIGAIASPVNNWWQEKEVGYLIQDCKPKILVMGLEFSGIALALKDSMDSVVELLIDSPSPVELDLPFKYFHEVLENADTDADLELQPTPEDAASLMYTSGTTGKPKGVILTHNGIVTASKMKISHVPVELGDSTLCTLPLFFSGGLNDVAYPCMSIPATIVLRRNFSAGEF